MGLLDDAIREHLELKRLQGADPGLVAREEREAFGPVSAGEPADIDSNVIAPGDFAIRGTPTTDNDPAQMSQLDHAQSFSNVGQETAELDMRTVLGDESDRDIIPIGPGVTGPVGSRASAEGVSPEQ
jgi:hypothetical protein